MPCVSLCGASITAACATPPAKTSAESITFIDFFTFPPHFFVPLATFPPIPNVGFFTHA